jgi:hypothetical protein
MEAPCEALGGCYPGGGARSNGGEMIGEIHVYFGP